MAGGRPLRFDSVEDFNKAVAAYIQKCRSDEVPLTISGLALSLDICTETLRNYELRDEFFAPVKRAKQMVEMAYEQRLHAAASTGAIFALKNFGWKDTQDISQTNLGAPQVIITKNYNKADKEGRNDDE